MLRFADLAKTNKDDMGDIQNKPVRQLLLLILGMVLGYVCIQTLRFTWDGLNVAVVCTFFAGPWFAVRPLLRLPRWPKVFATIVVTPLLALSVIALGFTAACDVPAVIEHKELSRELSVVRQGNCSVHLLWKETAGGAVGPHGVLLEQRMSLLPGLYLVKHIDYFEGAYEGGLSAEGAHSIRLHIPKENFSQEIDRVYTLKPRVYF